MDLVRIWLLLLALTALRAKLGVLSLATNNTLDYSYMKSVINATHMPLEETYDYIVVGGGTAGCPLAATLSENRSVLILERGGPPATSPNVLHADGLFASLIEAGGEGTPAQPFTSEEGVANVRGRVLGGSSMINAGLYSRADAKFLSESGVDWDPDQLEEAYRWVEESVVFRLSRGTWQSAVKEALIEVGVGPDNGFSLDHELGAKSTGSIFDPLGNRHGSVELLNKGNLENLRVAVHAYVERILFSTDGSTPSAIGVLYTDSNGDSHRALIRHNGEVILSAGTLGSPQLLLLSGVGPNSDLDSHHIPVVHSQPNVGKFMADNPRNNINLVLPFPLDNSPAQIAGITENYFIETVSCTFPFPPAPWPVSLFSWPAKTNVSVASLLEKTTGPFSHGELRLASPAEARVTPRVRFNYFSDERDLAYCVAGVRTMGEMMDSDALDRFKYTNLVGRKDFVFVGKAPPENRSDVASMEEFCRSTVATFWHYHGGCVVGKVVDSEFRVMGIEALRVVDASTLVRSPGTNPQATLMMLGRYVGLKMLKERSDNY